MKAFEAATESVVDQGTVAHGKGLKISRVFTKAGVDPFSTVEWERRRAEIKGNNGEVVFAMDNVEVPKTWSQTALDIAADKYLRKAGVPLADGSTGAETSVRDMISRVATGIRKAGDRFGGYFASQEDAQAFQDELIYVLLYQMAAFNSPAWFNCGLAEAYGILGKPSGNYFFDTEADYVREVFDSYTHPAASACFIVSVKDDLIDMAKHVEREMRIFRFGGGSGSSFSAIRAENEPLSNGGKSSGLMSFLKIWDVSAGTIKSGGTTRRAAKIVVLDADHPDIEKFVEWKAREEDKALALIKAGYPNDFNGEAYQTISGQNANNSVRVTDEFMQAVRDDKSWKTYFRTTKKLASEFPARRLFRKIAEAAHRCADPGLQFDTTIQKWHTSKNTGRIEASNPCSEFMFLNDTACNLSSINLMKFMTNEGRRWDFDVPAFRHVCRVMTLAKEIIVDYASYPTEAIAKNSHDYRPLGLGYANLGTAIMVQGLAYDSKDGLAFATAVNSMLSAFGYELSAEVAASKGPFPGFQKNREPMLEVMREHCKAAIRLGPNRFDRLSLASVDAWTSAIALGESYGYRNAQINVVAPTGTISFLMDCDTTGVEPDFSLVKHKKLAGGGYLKIVNQSVEKALRTLGYLGDCDPILKWIEANGTVEGAPGLSPEHYSVFDCANKAGKGKRFIQPMAHIKMLEAVQPFVSGSVSKTVNCPKETTVEEIEDLYMEAWKRGLKCIAIYRDGSKHSQPLSSGGDEKVEKKLEVAKTEPGSKSSKRTAEAPPETVRHRLPNKRPGGFTYELVVGGTKIYLRTGDYANGRPGEIFCDIAKEGAALRSLMSCFSIAISLGLQHGVPIKEFIDAFTLQQFAPAGVVKGHPNVKMSTSLVDAIFRVLAVEYEGNLEFAQVKTVERAVDFLDEMDAERTARNPHFPKLAAEAEEPKASDPKANGNGHSEPKVDGRMCDRCGGLLVRSGTCFACSICASTTGCS